MGASLKPSFRSSISFHLVTRTLAKMFLTAIVSFLLLPMTSLAAAAVPVDLIVRNSLGNRQARPPKPDPCQRMAPAPDATEAKERFDAFAKAFIYDKNITEAFLYITQDYIVALSRFYRRGG